MSDTATASGLEIGPIPLREVDKVLNQELQTAKGPGAAPVQRVRMSNLVIFCQNKEMADEIAAQVPAIVSVHPARVLLLLGEESAETRDITATIKVRTRQFEGVQACAELIRLNAAGGTVQRLPFAVRALLVGELPTNLWWACNQPPPLAGPLLHDLADQAQQVLYDSLGWPDPARGVAATAAWLEQLERPNGSGRWRVGSDLNWRRLKYWRRLVTQALDPASAPGVAEAIDEIVVEHGPHAVIQAWEMVSWLARRLTWHVQTGRLQPGVEISWRFSRPGGEVRVKLRRLEQGPPVLQSIRFGYRQDGKALALKLVRETESRLAVLVEGKEGAPRTLMVPPVTLAELVGRQLSDRERDPVFRDGMAVAQVLAQSLLR